MKPLLIAVLLVAPMVVCASSVAASEAGTEALGQLSELSNAELAKLDLAVLNLRCAQGLPGAGDVDESVVAAKLDAWAARIASETDRYLHLFKQNPAKFRDMEGFYRMQMLITVVMQDFGCRYNPARASDPENPEPAASFYEDAEDVFVNGFLGDEPMGTCASFPVLYADLGRRLGYPIKLVTARSHLFCRWDDEATGERFNIEGTNAGMNSHPDSYYKEWPFAMTDEEIEANSHLKSLSPREELAVFMCLRGICLSVHDRQREAGQAWALAGRLAPENGFYKRLCESLVASASTSSEPPQ